ncbi:MAG: hypothetical protein E7665_08420 [Ruminococcaceae bacterium]|nr:hypothetical protein [Oscillospiraceae bacterium]
MGLWCSVPFSPSQSRCKPDSSPTGRASRLFYAQKNLKPLHVGEVVYHDGEGQDNKVGNAVCRFSPPSQSRCKRDSSPIGRAS